MPEPARSAEAAATGASELARRKALKLLAFAAVGLLVWIARSVGVGLFLGMLVAFTLQPLYERLRANGRNGRTAALVCVLGMLSLISGAFAAFATLFLRRAVMLAEAAPGLLATGSPLRTAAERVMTRVHVSPETGFERLGREVVGIGSRVAELAGHVADATFAAILTLFFIGLSSYYILRHWDEVVLRAEQLMPLAPRHTRALFGQFQRVGSEVLRGTVLTGIVQGLLAGLGYWATGLPDPAFFGALTAVASVVPVVGTLLVWIPAGIFLIATDHVVAGISELIYGALVVGLLTDYVIRPRLVRGQSSPIPTVLMFVSLFGGVQVFGLTGLIVGPVMVTLCLAILRTYELEQLATPTAAEPSRPDAREGGLSPRRPP